MTENAPAAPLAYDAARPVRDSVLSVVGLAVAVLSLAVPAYMLAQVVAGKRHRFAVYQSYLHDGVTLGPGVRLSLYANWVWYAADSVALLLGLIGLYRGRARFAVAALLIAAVSMAGKMTLVLGSPW